MSNIFEVDVSNISGGPGYKSVTIVEQGLIYTPYIPMQTANWMPPYRLVRTCVDVAATWYTIKVDRDELHDWVIAHDSGWRYAANQRFNADYFGATYDLREDIYTLFVLRWSK